jgi:hypothetical protein
MVVPAKAGTHSHKPWFGEDSQFGTSTLPQPINYAVWVPAFAGTTERGYRNTPSSTGSPAITAIAISA